MDEAEDALADGRAPKRALAGGENHEVTAAKVEVGGLERREEPVVAVSAVLYVRPRERETGEQERVGVHEPAFRRPTKPPSRHAAARAPGIGRP